MSTIRPHACKSSILVTNPDLSLPYIEHGTHNSLSALTYSNSFRSETAEWESDIIYFGKDNAIYILTLVSDVKCFTENIHTGITIPLFQTTSYIFPLCSNVDELTFRDFVDS